MGEASKPRLPGAHRKPPGAGHALLFAARQVPRRTWVWLALVVALLVAGVAALLVFTEFDWAGLIRSIAGLPPVLLFVAMALLPIIGFPILPVYLVAGARFGPFGGGLAVAVATVVHLVGANLIARSILRRPLERLLRRWHAHLPEIPKDEEAAVSFIAALVPGIPYAVRNYLFPLMGLRLRVYLWIALPVYVARSYVSILLGDLGTDPDRTRLFILLGVEVLKVAICALVIWWLREHHRRVHGDPAHA
jgi:uncharacterized membrane protein YdjX (TVP38/TMEM64 family)